MSIEHKSLKRLSKVCCIFFGLLLVSCENPFFVHVSIPVEVIDLSTPENVIKLLKRAYESRRIDLYEDLFYSKTDFRFYIEHNNLYIDTSLQNINKNQFEKVSIDKNIDFVLADDSTYVYLTYSEEENIHRNMFRKTDQIVFGAFDPYKVDYFTTSVDSITTDTLDAIAYTDETDITMSSDLFSAVYGTRTVRFGISKQVFFMKRDTNRQWKIATWFELEGKGDDS